VNLNVIIYALSITKMNQDDFRRLLATPQPIKKK
jgi:hypothetical protein